MHDFAGYIQASVRTIFIAAEHWIKADLVSVDIIQSSF